MNHTKYLTYEAEMTCHMALHNDVLERIHTVLKQDDYFRTLKELPGINGLHTYDYIQLFLEFFELKNNSTEVICNHLLKLLYHVLPVSSLGPVQHSDLLHWLHHYLQQEKWQLNHFMHNRARKRPKAVYYNVGREHLWLQQTHRPKYNQIATLPTRVPLQIIYQLRCSNKMWYPGNCHHCPNPNFKTLMLFQYTSSLHILA